ncbi:MAG: LysR family transcriptional regulator, partial [Clostridia bacterium]|nr:LysR family transcriptional regulator [Clostridia bacterium]
IFMNARQLQYAIALSESLNFSQVAEQLGITQPALSKQIMNLEAELGVKLFDRSTTPLTVTPAGQHFLKEAAKLIYAEDQLMRSMEDFKSGQRGELNIGISPFRSLYLMPYVVKKIKEKYPLVKITLHELGSDILRKEASEGKYDLCIVNLPVDESVLDVTPIESDTLVLAVPKAMAVNLPSSENGKYPLVDLRKCQNLPFVAVTPSQEMRKLLEKSCAAADFTPNISVEVVGLSTAWRMCCWGLGATLLPLQYIKSTGLDEAVELFTLKQSVRSRQPAIVTRRGQYISEYAQYVIDLLTEQNT